MNSSIDSDDGGNQRELSEGSDVLLPQCSVLADEEYLWSKDIVLQDQFQSRLGDNFAVIQEMAIMLNSALMMDSATIKTGCSAVDLEQRLRGLNYMTLKGIYELCGGMSDSARVSRDQVLQLPCFSTVIETVKQEDVYLYKAVIFPGVEELTNSILENGQLFNMKSEILRSKKMSRHSNPLDAYQAKVLCNFLCELIAKLSRESPSNKNGVMYQHLQERFAKLKSGQGANAELELIGKYEEVLDFDKNKSLKELIKNMGKRSSILKLLGMPIFEPISSNDGIDPSRPTVFLCLQQGFNIPPYDEMDLEETKNRRPSGKKATKQRKNEAKATAMTGKDTSEEAEENESALSPNAEGPSSWDSDSDSDSDSESETYVQAETENEVLNDPQPVAEKVISPLDRATKVRQASMQQRSVPIWQAEDEPDDEEIVMYSDDEVSEEQIAERETRLKAKRQMEKMMEKTRLENLEKNLEAQRKKDEFRCLNEEADQIGKYLRARNWYKAVECRQPMSGGGLASASANGDQFQLLNVFSVRPPEDAFQSEFRPVATPLLSRSSSANSQSDFELPNQQPGSSASSSPPNQMPTPLVHPQPINPTVVQQSERKKVQNWDEPSSSQQQQQASNQPTQKPKPKPMPLKVQTRQLRDAPPGIEGPLDYHDKKHRPQFPGEVAKHHANAKVSEFDQFKKKIETLEGNGDGSKPKMAFNMMTERRYSGHNSEVVRLPFVQKPLTFGKLGEKIDRTSPASASATPPSVRNSSPPRRASPPNESRQPSYDFHRNAPLPRQRMCGPDPDRVDEERSRPLHYQERLPVAREFGSQSSNRRPPSPTEQHHFPSSPRNFHPRNNYDRPQQQSGFGFAAANRRSATAEDDAAHRQGGSRMEQQYRPTSVQPQQMQVKLKPAQPLPRMQSHREWQLYIILSHARLEEYFEKFSEQGADDIDQMTEDFDELLQIVGMTKPFHIKRLRASLDVGQHTVYPTSMTSLLYRELHLRSLHIYSNSEIPGIYYIRLNIWFLMTWKK
ncbi:hypothetical protein WR25_25142 isoform A [Diploscapter pachys]|nr:hypothetical protein WR25_25142 isoform A [Diploscapter pachys]